MGGCFSDDSGSDDQFANTEETTALAKPPKVEANELPVTLYDVSHGLIELRVGLSDNEIRQCRRFHLSYQYLYDTERESESKTPPRSRSEMKEWKEVAFPSRKIRYDTKALVLKINEETFDFAMRLSLRTDTGLECVPIDVQVPFDPLGAQREWQVGDIVQVTPPGEVVVHKGTITEKRPKEKKGGYEYRVKLTNKPEHLKEEEYNVAEEEITVLSQYQDMILDITDKERTAKERLILLGRSKAVHESISAALFDMSVALREEIVESYFRDIPDTSQLPPSVLLAFRQRVMQSVKKDWQLNTDHVAMLVLEMLEAPRQQWKFKCELCQRSGSLCALRRPDTMWHNMIESKTVVHRAGVREFDIERLVKICDICHTQIGKEEYMFWCDTPNVFQRHDFCIHCIDRRVARHNQLLQVLHDLLFQEYGIIRDCVFEIAAFAVGDVVAIVY